MKFVHKFLLLSFVIYLTSFYGSCDKDPVTPVVPTAPQIGTLESSIIDIEVNTTTNITFRYSIASGISLVDSLVKLNKVDNSGNLSTQLGILQDNGNLANGDDIAGDGVYSGIFSIVESAVGVSRYAASASLIVEGQTVTGMSKIDTITVYNALSNSTVGQVMTVLTAGENHFVTALAGNVGNYASAFNSTATFLQTQSGVTSVDAGSGSTSMEVTFSSGVHGTLTLSLANANGTVLTRGGQLDDDPLKKRAKGPTIPIERQTRGENLFGPQREVIENIDNPNLEPNIIGNRNVLIFAPYEAAFAPANERNTIINNLNNAECRGFEVTSLVNQEATVKSIMDITKYGFVILATHGVQGRWFYTAETVDTASNDYKTIYKPLITAGRLGIANNIVISNTGGVVTRKNVYAIHHSFISSRTGTFPNSIILNNSCEGTMNPDLSNAFRNKGAKTYYGYSKVVNSAFCVTIADTVSKRFARGLNSGQAFMASTDPVAPNAVFQMNGANDMSFSLKLLNGNFDAGTLEGFTKEGDGRVITRLNVVNPTQGSFMGIISTGLGFTTSSGSIAQCVKIEDNQSNLTLKWNFLSEEFLEFINSQFQDFFQISVTKPDGVEVILYRKTIDEIAAMFGATQQNPGSLVRVSPGIVFDQGDVYMTNWQTLTLNVTAFRGMIINIKFSAGDVGDSIYDTAILLDEILIN
ncbi:MAG TPA: choice-of-anchor L domain-containing protein [Ignavibacteria bacterium]|nr:choice-of-anchor L domain-containing protein [Ignavibacteria bacterium]